MPYFEKTISRLFLLMSITEPIDLPLRSVATDCIGAVASAVGKDLFMVLSNIIYLTASHILTLSCKW